MINFTFVAELEVFDVISHLLTRIALSITVISFFSLTAAINAINLLKIHFWVPGTQKFLVITEMAFIVESVALIL